MIQYRELVREILHHGDTKKDRTGVGTRSLFGWHMQFCIQNQFPLLTLKQTSFKNIATELLWFLKGNPDISYLHANNNHIWDEWVRPDGTFGPIYGYQWRSWPKRDGGSINQIANVINKLKTNPDDRRMIVSAWNVEDVESGQMALPPCHVMFQFYSREMTTQERMTHDRRTNNAAGFGVDLFDLVMDEDPNAIALVEKRMDELNLPKRFLSCQIYQRSCDVFLGVPYNIASYALLTYMVAHVTNMAPDMLNWVGGDVHLYNNHLEQAEEMMKRTAPTLPTLKIVGDVKNIDDFELNNFVVSGYAPLPAIKADVAV